MLTDVLCFSQLLQPNVRSAQHTFKQVPNHRKFTEGANPFEVKLPMQFLQRHSLQIHDPSLLNKHSAIGTLFTAK